MKSYKNKFVTYLEIKKANKEKEREAFEWLMANGKFGHDFRCDLREFNNHSVAWFRCYKTIKVSIYNDALACNFTILYGDLFRTCAYFNERMFPRKMLMPIIRKLSPQLIANAIVGNTPLSGLNSIIKSAQDDLDNC